MEGIQLWKRSTCRQRKENKKKRCFHVIAAKLKIKATAVTIMLE